MRVSLVVAAAMALNACGPFDRVPVHTSKAVVLVPAKSPSDFEQVAIPIAGNAEDISGLVELLTDDGEWVALPEGRVLGDGTQLRLGAGARLFIRYSVSERVELVPGSADRLVHLKVTKVAAHGT
jgi:hypothetical protein